MILFYSGSDSKHIAPERTLAEEKVGFMLTYADFALNKRRTTIRRFEKHRERMRNHERRKRK